MAYDRLREIDEAIAAGRRALSALDEAGDALESARRWGVWDIVGGGLFSSLIKHGRIDEAEDALARARAELSRFSRELDDVRGAESLQVGVGKLNTVFDIALDNVLTDLFVQSSISDAADRVEEVTDQVRRAVARLETARSRGL